MNLQKFNVDNNFTNLENYIASLDEIVLNDLTEAIKNTNDLEETVKKGFQEEFSKKFSKNLNKSSQNMILSLKNLSKIFNEELSDIKSNTIEKNSISESE